LCSLLGLAIGLAACSEGVDSAASFTFGPPDPTNGDLTTGSDPATSSTGADPTIGSGGISDSATPTTSNGDTTTDAPSTGNTDPTTATDDTTTGTPGECEAGETRSCYTGPEGTENVGPCVAGTQTCGDDGTWDAGCDGEVLPMTEDCDGEDNDCDGAADNDNPDGGDACNTGLSGPCQPGVLVCVNGALICDGNVDPAPDEICDNGIDDDCTGVADDGCGCDPGNPAIDCMPGESCFPTPTFGDEAVCAGPVGTGTQYAACLGNSDCAPGHTCVDTGVNAYCLQWCTSFDQCPFVLDDCLAPDTPVYDGVQEWGVCYDGLG